MRAKHKRVSEEEDKPSETRGGNTLAAQSLGKLTSRFTSPGLQHFAEKAGLLGKLERGFFITTESPASNFSQLYHTLLMKLS